MKVVLSDVGTGNTSIKHLLKDIVNQDIEIDYEKPLPTEYVEPFEESYLIKENENLKKLHKILGELNKDEDKNTFA